MAKKKPVDKKRLEILWKGLDNVAELLRPPYRTNGADVRRQELHRVSTECVVALLPCTEPELRKGAALLLLVRHRTENKYLGDFKILGRVPPGFNVSRDEWACKQIQGCADDIGTDIELESAEFEVTLNALRPVGNPGIGKDEDARRLPIMEELHGTKGAKRQEIHKKHGTTDKEVDGWKRRRRRRK